MANLDTAVLVVVFHLLYLVLPIGFVAIPLICVATADSVYSSRAIVGATWIVSMDTTAPQSTGPSYYESVASADR